MRAANYVEETTTSIAGASGDGAVTMTQITSRPRFSTVFGTQNTTVRYVIEDTVNFKFETGIGHVSSNVLTRTKVAVTWDGTTYTDNGASALQFGSSPTSGNVKIRMSPVGEDTFRGFGSVQTAASGDSWRDYRFSDHWVGVNDAGATGQAVTADREYYQPYMISSGGVISGVQLEITALVAASNFKWALYGCGDNGLPSAKIVDFVTTSSASTGVKTDPTTASWSPAGKFRLTPGWYFIGLIFSHAVTCRHVGTNKSFLMSHNPLGRKDAYGSAPYIYVAGNYTTGLPATANLTGGTLGTAGAVPTSFFLGLRRDAA